MPAKKIHIDKIGEVSFLKNRRSSGIRLTVKPDGVRVSLPSWVPYQDAINFAETKTDWILKQQIKLASGLTVFGPETKFSTKYHQVKIVIGNYPKVYNRISNGIVQFFIPEKYDHRHSDIQAFIKNTLLQVMRFEAKSYLPKRTKELADKYHLQYKNVSVKNVKTRWGSCSSENNINLNIHLMRLPDHLIDYVILHELAHTVEKNHSPAFWKLLDKMVGNSKLLRKEMRNYRVGF